MDLQKIFQGFYGCYDEEQHEEKPNDDTGRCLMTGEPSDISGSGRGFSDIGVDPDLLILLSANQYGLSLTSSWFHDAMMRLIEYRVP